MPSTISAGTTAGTAIAIAGDTTGNLAFQTNGTTTAMTINTSQNVQLNAAAGKILNSSGNPILQQTGSVLQVVSATSTTRQSILSASFVDITEMALSITPTSSTSKILVLIMISASGGNNNSLINLYRGSTTILTGAGATYNGAVGTSNVTNAATVTQPIIYLDSPATASSVNYNLKGTSLATGAPLVINQRASDTNVVSAASTITLMEIAA